MRLDKYLKVSRLIKRRTVANEACDNARISVNGRPAKASYDVKVGDKISIEFGARTLTVEVLAVAEAVRKDDASAMYREMLGKPLNHLSAVFGGSFAPCRSLKDLKSTKDVCVLQILLGTKLSPNTTTAAS